MKLPIEMFLSSIEEKKVYYFSTTQINTVEPHYFVCIKRTDSDILIMGCCTSQFGTMKRMIEINGVPMETIVWISPKDTNNPFTKDTYVNCNEPKTFTVDEFRVMYSADSVDHSGEVSEAHYTQILTGIHLSPLVADETKDLIPFAGA